MSDYGYPLTFAFWQKLTPAQRVTLTLAQDMRHYGNIKGGKRYSHEAEEILNHAEYAMSEDFGDIRTQLCTCIERYLEIKPEATVPDMLLHIITHA